MFSKFCVVKNSKIITRYFSRNSILNKNYSCKLLVVGGGSGGCSVVARFQNEIKDNIILVDPADTHYYQPLFTLVGGGIKEMHEAGRRMATVLPKNLPWLQDGVTAFKPKDNSVTMKNGDEIKYEFMLIGVGLELHFDKIPGLVEALTDENSGVCSIYSPLYVEKTYESLQKFNSGNLIFTFPRMPVKCAGAPLKICLISEHFLRKAGKRDGAIIHYNSSLGKIFAVQKYADALEDICEKRNINTNFKTNLIEVKPEEKVGIFEKLDDPEARIRMEYSLLHVTPPMGTPKALSECKELVDKQGFVDVDKGTLQSVHFNNVFAIGDCGNTPNSKTAAAVAAQSYVVYNNLKLAMAGKKSINIYNGYTSCPLVTGYGTCIMAEFDYNLTPMESFPFNQANESYLMYLLKKNILPKVYWDWMLKGKWNGPSTIRKVLHLGMK